MFIVMYMYMYVDSPLVYTNQTIFNWHAHVLHVLINRFLFIYTADHTFNEGSTHALTLVRGKALVWTV